MHKLGSDFNISQPFLKLMKMVPSSQSAKSSSWKDLSFIELPIEELLTLPMLCLSSSSEIFDINLSRIYGIPKASDCGYGSNYSVTILSNGSRLASCNGSEISDTLISACSIGGG